METLAAVALAGNVVQFLDFGGKLIDGALELRGSKDGATSTTVVLEAATKSLRYMCDELTRSEFDMSRKIMTGSMVDLVPLAKSCRTLSEEFLAFLDTMKVKHGSKGWDSVRQSWKNHFKEKKLQRYRTELESYRAQITSVLTLILTSVLSIFPD